MEQYAQIRFAVSDGIAEIVLDTPENFNAMTEAMLRELQHALLRCADDADIGVVVLRGEGRAFCAGGDVKSMQRGICGEDDEMLPRIVRAAGKVAVCLRALPQPVLAAIHGVVAGAGWSLALLCDFRIIAEEVRFVDAFIHLGLVPDMGGTYVLSRYLGLGRLTEFLMMGGVLTAQQALDFGLVNAVVSRDALAAEVAAYAEKLKSMPRDALARTKALINQTLFAGLERSLDLEDKYQTLLAQSRDYKEGVEAFLSKRTPQFNRKFI